MMLDELRHSYELVLGTERRPVGATVNPRVEMVIKDTARIVDKFDSCFYGMQIYTIIKQEESVILWYDTQSMTAYIKRMEAK